MEICRAIDIVLVISASCSDGALERYNLGSKSSVIYSHYYIVEK